MKALRGLSLLLSILAALNLARATLLSRRVGLPLGGAIRPYWFSLGVVAGVAILAVGMGVARSCAVKLLI
jgi:hypothetical protein